MAEQKLNIVVGGEDKSKPAFRSVAQSLSDLKKTAGEGGPLGEFAKMARGAGAVAGIALAARTLSDLTSKAVSFRDAMRDGSKSAGDVADELARSIPVLGSIYAAGRNLRELITGQQAEINKLLAAAAAQDANIANRRGQDEAGAPSKSIFSRMREKLFNSFSASPATETRKIQQDTRDEIVSINKVLADARKAIDAAAKFAVPGADGKAREIQGVDALRKELAEILAKPEAVRPDLKEQNAVDPGTFNGRTAMGDDFLRGSAKGTYDERVAVADDLQHLAKQIQSRIAAAERAIVDANADAQRTIALSSARGYVDLGKLFMSQVRQRFDEGVAAQMKQNAPVVAAREAARNKFGSVLKSIIGGTLDAVGDAVGGKQGAEKYLRENGQLGLMFRLFNKIGAIGGSGTPTKLAEAEALNPLLASRGVGVNDQRYVTGISNPDDAIARAQIESARLLKEQAGIQKESRDLLRQIGQYLKDGGTVVGFGL